MVVRAFTWEVKEGRPGVQGQPWILEVQSYIGLPKTLFQQNKAFISTVIYRQELGLTVEI